MVETSVALGSSASLGSTKKLTVNSFSSPGRRSCSVKQKHSILLKYSPVLNGVTLKAAVPRSEEHTSELQSLMRISYAVFCLKKKRQTNNNAKHTSHGVQDT